ncbi:hypothetical protein OVA07_04060 [Novosphingobium sp. SL115]|nr:hypothetical protein [Novosphingobium sp. SL115]
MTAKRRCSEAVRWFQETVERMARAGMLDRDTLEEAANAYFAQLVREVDQPRDLPADDYDNALAVQIEQSENEIERYDGHLRAHSYTDGDRNAARAMLKPMGVDFDELGPDGQLAALSHVVRAKRQQMRYLLHGLQTPASQFIADDELFGSRSLAPAVQAALPASDPKPGLLRPEVTLGSSIDKFMAYQTKKGWKGSMRDETMRLFGWLKEEIDPDTPVESITLAQAQAFRDCLMDLGKGAQGRKLPLRQKLAFPGQERLKFATRQRYWRFTKLLFKWIEDEERVPDPIGSLRFEGGRDEVQESPEPFTTDELKRFLRSPLFTGYKSPHRTKQVGDCHIRGGHWWSAIIMMFTGMRAGDVVQLLPTDFVFDASVPHLIIQPGLLPEGKRKSSKFGQKKHIVPLHPSLLTLGLRQFVAGRTKQNPKRRLLYEIALGGNRQSAGMTKYWSAFLHEFKLYKSRRATHVHRHTVIALLRAAHVAGEDIAAIVGHYGSYRETMTERYGGPQGLERKLATLAKLDHGFDVVGALGGPYDPKVHRY